MKYIEGADEKLAKKLVLDELFDLTLYKALLKFANADEIRILEKLIPVESGHFTFWKKFFGIEIESLNFFRKIKLYIFLAICRIFGRPGIHLMLEALEINGIKKYLDIWKQYKDKEMRGAIRKILEDEFRHEDEIVSEYERRKIHPERIRDIFLGFNDGLVEILGAVSGFFAAFHDQTSVLIAGLTVGVAGSISMAASVFASSSSATEVENREEEKLRFLGQSDGDDESPKPITSSIIVGISYFIGAMVPILPVFFGAKNILLSSAVSAVIIILVSYIVAFLSGMQPLRRIMSNLFIIALAVSVTYLIGTIAKSFFGISVG
ncbi:MAG: Ferritin, CCC1 [Parcubacteria group bacterium GW2011_GWA2_47_12]|nr:MAG: Ferritin, CCC1 [Parcubacteria group bacterium GW2011_GWA2_47_12]